MTDKKIVSKGTIERTPAVETALEAVAEFGPLEVEITKRDVARLAQLPSDHRREALRELLRTKFQGEKEQAVALQVEKNLAVDIEVLRRLENEPEALEALMKTEFFQHRYCLNKVVE
jgi:hypothetical protein